MLSDPELAALDDWRFKNRIATRAETTRRLVGLGLTVNCEEPNNGATEAWR
jgi:hypothetical protein